jgi:hypothetical protein
VLTASLDFLDDGRRYRAEIYRDGPDADYKGKREDIVIEAARGHRRPHPDPAPSRPAAARPSASFRWAARRPGRRA